MRGTNWFDVAGDAPLTLVVETPQGLLVRPVAPALPPPSGPDLGLGIEEATRQAAALWGLPDFVFQPEIRHVGSGPKELGDCIVIAGSRAAVVQVKSRQGGTFRDEKGERAWAQKHASKASRQAKGTIRSLQANPATLTNRRGHRVEVDGNLYDWLAVVIIDHPEPPTRTSVELNAGVPAVALLRRDWDFLFDQLRSTTTVMEYLSRIAQMPACPLGEESVRYYRIAAADLQALPGEFDFDWLGPHRQRVDLPRLPQVPVGSDSSRAHRLLRIISEDIATSPMPDGVDERDRLQALHDIDCLPVGARTEWGEWLLSAMDGVRQNLTLPFRSRVTCLGDREPLQLIFRVCGLPLDEDVLLETQGYLELRHHEFQEAAPNPADSRTTLLVLLALESHEQRPWTTVMLRRSGRSVLTAEQVALGQKIYNRGLF